MLQWWTFKESSISLLKVSIELGGYRWMEDDSGLHQYSFSTKVGASKGWSSKWEIQMFLLQQSRPGTSPILPQFASIHFVHGWNPVSLEKVVFEISTLLDLGHHQHYPFQNISSRKSSKHQGSATWWLIQIHFSNFLALWWPNQLTNSFCPGWDPNLSIRCCSCSFPRV